jgi:hypothetical protein
MFSYSRRALSSLLTVIVDNQRRKDLFRGEAVNRSRQSRRLITGG